MDLFDPKPALEKFHGADAPGNLPEVAPAGRSVKGKVMRSRKEVCPPRPKRRVGERIAAAHGQDDRRDRDHPLDVQRARES